LTPPRPERLPSHIAPYQIVSPLGGGSSAMIAERVCTADSRVNGMLRRRQLVQDHAEGN
jgi:hypothetical protein